jgi:dUTP pyrophosphatase
MNSSGMNINSNGINMNSNTQQKMYTQSSSPLQIPQQHQQQQPQYNMMRQSFDTYTQQPLPQSYTMTPPNTNVMNSSSSSPYFSPSPLGVFNQQNIPSLSLAQQQQQPQQIYSQGQGQQQHQNYYLQQQPQQQIIGQSIKPYKINRPYFQLEMYVPKELKPFYEKVVSDHNKVSLQAIVGGMFSEFNAGFDLLVPSKLTAQGYKTVKIDHNVKCRMNLIFSHQSMSFNVYQDKDGILRTYNTTNVPVGFYLYPRSSTGSKTPLRLSNSVGIIDSGYRGPLIAMFDNWKLEEYEIQENQRLVQLCPPDISNPMYIILVDTEEELGKTNRGSGGFGSTGV